MKVGITGTREGMNARQLDAVSEFLNKLPPDTELHHGDCKGVDTQVAAIAKSLGFRIVCHPPSRKEMRGFFGGHESRPEKDYLERDRNIVDETEFLIVVPLTDQKQPGSGTWYTHDYAVKRGKSVVIFYPNLGVDN